MSCFSYKISIRTIINIDYIYQIALNNRKSLILLKVVKKTFCHLKIYFIKPCLKIRDAWGFAHKGSMVNASTVDNSADIINKKGGIKNER